MRDDLLFDEDNFFVSKTLKQIDSNVGYKIENQNKLIKNLQESNKEKNKDFILKNKQMHLELIRKNALKLEEIKRRENSKNNIHQLNIISTPYNLQFLPKISPFIQSVDNILILDSKKAQKVGSKGFEYVWKQENLLKLANIKPDEIISYKKNSKSPNKHRNTHYFSHNIHDDQDNIFDLNYNERKKPCDEIIALRDRLNRILNQNKKVNTKFNLHKALALKFKVKKIYHPKYESIEKHKAEIILNNKTKRLFPENLMQKSYYIDNNDNANIIKNKEKTDKIISKDKKKSYYICSSLSLNNIFSQTPNNYKNINEKNKYNRNGINMKLSSFTTYNNNSNENLKKSKSQANMNDK